MFLLRTLFWSSDAMAADCFGLFLQTEGFRDQSASSPKDAKTTRDHFLLHKFPGLTGRHDWTARFASVLNYRTHSSSPDDQFNSIFSHSFGLALTMWRGQTLPARSAVPFVVRGYLVSTPANSSGAIPLVTENVIKGTIPDPTSNRLLDDFMDDIQSSMSNYMSSKAKNLRLRIHHNRLQRGAATSFYRELMSRKVSRIGGHWPGTSRRFGETGKFVKFDRF